MVQARPGQARPCRADSADSPSYSRWPRATTASMKPGAVTASSAASAAAQTSALPWKVSPWSPGEKQHTDSRASVAPMGAPPPWPLPCVRMSGSTPHWVAAGRHHRQRVAMEAVFKAQQRAGAAVLGAALTAAFAMFVLRSPFARRPHRGLVGLGPAGADECAAQTAQPGQPLGQFNRLVVVKARPGPAKPGPAWPGLACSSLLARRVSACANAGGAWPSVLTAQPCTRSR